MTYDEFHSKLDNIKIDFKKSRGRDLVTIAELEEFLVGRKVDTSKRSKGAKSLKGLF